MSNSPYGWPKYPPFCSLCGNDLPRADGRIPSYLPCPRHPRSFHVYRLQESQHGYPAGWPLCRACSKPALDGKLTCGQVSCVLTLGPGGYYDGGGGKAA